MEMLNLKSLGIEEKEVKEVNEYGIPNPGDLKLGERVEVLSTDPGKNGVVVDTGVIVGWQDATNYHGVNLGYSYYVKHDGGGVVWGHSIYIVRRKSTL